jgi:hypothetical protein
MCLYGENMRDVFYYLSEWVFYDYFGERKWWLGDKSDNQDKLCILKFSFFCPSQPEFLL